MVTVPEAPQETGTESVLRDHRTFDPITFGAVLVDGGDTGTGCAGGATGSDGVDDGGAAAAGAPGASSAGMNGNDGGGGPSDDPWADAMLTDAAHISAAAISAPRETRVRRSIIRPRLMSHLFSHPGAVIS
jgi:hypothetical protein